MFDYLQTTEYFSPTKIGALTNISRINVNKKLVEMEFLESTPDKGWVATHNANGYFLQCYNDSKNKKPYVLWNIKIIELLGGSPYEYVNKFISHNKKMKNDNQIEKPILE